MLKKGLRFGVGLFKEPLVEEGLDILEGAISSAEGAVGGAAGAGVGGGGVFVVATGSAAAEKSEMPSRALARR